MRVPVQVWHFLPRRKQWFLLMIFLHVDPELEDFAGSWIEYPEGQRRKVRPRMVLALRCDFSTINQATSIGFKHSRCPDLSKPVRVIRLRTFLCASDIKTNSGWLEQKRTFYLTSLKTSGVIWASDLADTGINNASSLCLSSALCADFILRLPAGAWCLPQRQPSYPHDSEYTKENIFFSPSIPRKCLVVDSLASVGSHAHL